MEANFLLINKPKDWTSHDMVAFIRNRIRKSGLSGYPDSKNKKIKVGHAGTLDPFATGLLIVGIGREATKRLDEFKNLPKTYIATLKLGATSDTYDSEGKITEYNNRWLNSLIVKWLTKFWGGNNNLITKPFNNFIYRKPTTEDIKKVLNKFIGKQQQTPPMFSAKKVGGKKLYDLARKGIEIERQPCEIEIYNLELLEYNPKTYSLKFKAEVSTGTYIRTLAHDIGQRLGCGAYCEELERIAIGKYRVEDAIDIKEYNFQNAYFLKKTVYKSFFTL